MVGVVFNEMKGVYTQPDNIMGRVTQQVSNLFNSVFILVLSSVGGFAYVFCHALHDSTLELCHCNLIQLLYQPVN
jgi:hypothetical protein